MKKLVLALVVALLVSGCGGVAAPKVARLPDATLQPLRESGKPARLSALRGPMVVNLWANWCKPCRREMPIYEEFHHKHPDVPVLGVNWEDPARTKALEVADKAGVTYPLVVDYRPVIAGKGLPKLILIDTQGHIAFQDYVEIKSLPQLEALVHEHLKARQ